MFKDKNIIAKTSKTYSSFPTWEERRAVLRLLTLIYILWTFILQVYS